MKILITARNIVNQEEFSTFLDNLIKDRRVEKPQITLWITTQLKKYLQNDYSDVTKVTELKEEYPDWLKDSIKNGTALKLNFDDIDFTNDCNHIIDYFNSLDEDELNKISKIPFLVAKSKAEKWLNELIEKSDSRENINGIEVVRKYKDGFSWVRVFSQQSLNREGKLMRHCVGSYYEEVSNDNCIIYSLRTEENIPKCTVEVIKNTINQIKGFANGPISEKYVKYVKNFIKTPIEGNSYKSIKELWNIGILVQDRVWYNVYNLPNNFVVKHNLHFNARFSNHPIKLPKTLTINKSLWIKNASKVILPETLIVKERIHISSCSNVIMPKTLVAGALSLESVFIDFKGCNTIIHDWLGIEGTENKTIILDKNVKIDGELTVDSRYSNVMVKEGCKIPSIDCGGNLILPDNYTCSKLYIYEIPELPKNLMVDELYIEEDGKIDELPMGLVVNKTLRLEREIHFYPDIIVKGSVICLFKQDRDDRNLYMDPKPKGVRKVIRRNKGN